MTCRREKIFSRAHLAIISLISDAVWMGMLKTLLLTLITNHLSIMSFGLSTSKIADFAAKPFVRAALKDPYQPGSVLSFFLVRCVRNICREGSMTYVQQVVLNSRLLQ